LSTLLFQVAAVYTDDVVLALGVRHGDALSWVLFAAGIQKFPEMDPVDVD